MRHEIVEFEFPILAVAVGIERGKQGRPTLYPHPKMQSPAHCPVPTPSYELPIAQPLLGFSDSPAANPAQDQFMPKFI